MYVGLYVFMHLYISRSADEAKPKQKQKKKTCMAV